RFKKEPMHPRFPVWQAVTQEPEAPGKPWIRRHGMMRHGVQGIINRYTGTRTKPQIGVDHWRAATIGENKIVLRDALAEGISRMPLHPVQPCRRIHIP